MNIPLNEAHELYSFPARILRSARHILSHPLSALINSYTSLERKSFVKYLGMLIDENLSWKHHILYIASKISTLIDIIAR